VLSGIQGSAGEGGNPQPTKLSKMNLYRLRASLLLPFRAWLPASEYTGRARYFDEQWETEITLGHSQFFPVSLGRDQIDASLCTVAVVETYVEFDGDRESAKTWARNHCHAIVADTILPRVNEFVLQLKYLYPKAILTGTMRNVGDIDLVYSYLYFEDDNIHCRSSPALSSWHGAPVPGLLLGGDEPLPGPGQDRAVPFRELSKEWVAVTRAVDLVNHGYFEEAVLVSFALLDALVQDFLKVRLPNLSEGEAATVIARVGSSRLNTFLGPLMRVCTGASPLDENAGQAELAWLNKKRNAIVHNGDPCSRIESQRGVAMVWRLLRYLNEKGATYRLPPNLEFWTPSDGGKIKL